jgi:hypothetical protein
MIKVQSTGGLGNQLFQWAYAHHLIMTGTECSCIVFSDSIHTANRISRLQSIENDCSHNIKFVNSEISGRALQIVDKISTFSPQLSRFFSKIIGLSTEQKYQTIDQIAENRSRLIRGYFQLPSQMPEAIWAVSRELESLIVGDVSTPTVYDDYQLIHIRRKDFMNNKNTHGVLSVEYYAQALIPDLPLVIIGDEDVLPRDFGNLVNEFQYFGPRELGELEAMFLALKCQRFVMSNSTFSWWCGILAASKGKQVIMPSPWTKSEQNWVNLHFSNFTPQESIFI